jgi:MIP family channel proteins
MTKMEALSLPERLRERFRVRNPLLINVLSEFFATTLMLFVGTGIVAQYVLSEGKLNTWMHINLGWGFLIALCVYGTYRTSGGHMNPAVSLAMWTLGKLPLTHVLIYSVVQTIGAFLGVSMSFFVYKDQVEKFTGGVRTISGAQGTAGIFCSFPPEHVGHLNAFVDQVAGTALLVLFITIVIDKRNEIPTYLHPLLFGLALFVVGASYGMNVGYPINPARDFGPRLFAYFAGYGWEVFSWHSYYFYIPIIAPLFGSVLGAWSYLFFVGFHIPDTAVVITATNGKHPDELEPLA